MFNFQFGGEEDEEDHHQHRGGRRGGGGAPKKDVDTTKFYQVLGIEKGANDEAIKKAYRTLARVHHPDKGGDPEKFKEITRANEVLSDPKKRELYDQYGEEGVERGGPPQESMDIFDILGGGMGRRGGGQRVRKGEDVVFPLKVELNDLYNGASKKLRLTKNVICKACAGKGGKSESVKKCASCKGHGIKVVVRQVGPGMIQQMQIQCEQCNATGQVIAEKDRCTVCKGERTVKEQKTLEVYVARGMQHGQRIPFKGEADEAPGTEPGDVVVVLQQKEHALFRRDGVNLFMKKKVTLVEALCGFNFRIPHLDNSGRTLLVKSDPGQILRPGDVKCIRDEGMPHARHPSRKGSLYVEIVIEFPASGSLADSTLVELRKLLPAPPVDPADKKPADAAAAGGAAAPAKKKKKNKKKSAGAEGATNGTDATDSAEEGKDQNGGTADGPVEEDVTMEDVNMEEERRKFAEQQKEAYEEAGEEREARGGGQPGCRAQ